MTARQKGGRNMEQERSLDKSRGPGWEEQKRTLAQLALQARENAYAPYSHWAVGAALLAEGGGVFCGCNVENAAYGPTNCAERTALFSAVAQGKRRFLAIAIAGGPQGQAPSGFCPPCGVCRQALAEFCGPDFSIFLVKSPEEVVEHTLGELLPLCFTL